MSNIEKKFEKILEDKDYIEVKYRSHEISKENLYSKRYANCNGVVLLNHDYAGLYHYGLIHSKLENPLLFLIAKMFDLTGLNGLKAVIIGGDNTHFNSNKETIEYFKIPIVGQYLDSWNEDMIDFDSWNECMVNHFKNSFPASKPKLTGVRKDLLVIPKTQEVIIYSKPVGYKRLFPN